MTPLDKTLKRELKIEGRAFVVAVSPEGLKLTLKGKRLGQELRWTDLISGEAALATALNASLGEFAQDPPPKRTPSPKEAAPAPKRASAPKRARPEAKRAPAPKAPRPAPTRASPGAKRPVKSASKAKRSR